MVKDHGRPSRWTLKSLLLFSNDVFMVDAFLAKKIMLSEKYFDCCCFSFCSVVLFQVLPNWSLATNIIIILITEMIFMVR